MMSEFIRKLSLAILLLLSSVFCCYAQESSLEQPAITDLSTLDLWNKIELNLNSLESEQLFSQIRLQELEKSLEISEKACQDKELVCLNLESSLAKSENATKRWKTFSIVMGSTTIALGISTAITILILVNK